MLPLRFLPVLAAAIAATPSAVLAAQAPAPTAIDVPRSAAVVIDGRMDEAEWRAATVHEVADSITIRLQHAAGDLFVGIASAHPAFASVCVAQADSVRVLHASAALGSVGYAREGESGAWVTGETKFVYGMRNPELTEAARAERREYLARHGWVASTARMGDGKVQELQLSRERIAGLTGLAVALFLPAGDAGTVVAWPAAAAADGCADERLVRGHVPERLAFEPGRWLQLRFEP